MGGPGMPRDAEWTSCVRADQSDHMTCVIHQ